MAIWLLSIVFNGIHFAALLAKRMDVRAYSGFISLLIIKSPPTVGIVFMYCLLIWTVKKSRKCANNPVPNSANWIAEEKDRRMRKIVFRLVVALLICYLPLIISEYYLYAVNLHRYSMKYTFEVVLNSY